jgi:hypothetical protein
VTPHAKRFRVAQRRSLLRIERAARLHDSLQPAMQLRASFIMDIVALDSAPRRIDFDRTTTQHRTHSLRLIRSS